MSTTSVRTRHVLSASFSLLVATAAAHAQGPARIPTGLGNAFANIQVTEPRGEFGKNTGNGFGVGGGLLIRVDPKAILNWRTELGVVTYGTSTRRIPLAGTGGLVKLDLKTSSNIFSMVTGPQLMGAVGAFTPYVSALGGFSVFWTESSVEGSNNDNEPFASTTNLHNTVRAYGGSAGVYIRVYEGVHPVRVELGARMLRHDNVKYLNKDRVRDAFENDRDPVPIRGRADFLTYYAGASVVVF